MSINHEDNFETTVKTPGSAASSVTTPVTDIPTVDAPYNLTLDADNANAHYEVVLVISDAANEITHAASTYAHSAGEVVRMTLPSSEINPTITTATDAATVTFNLGTSMQQVTLGGNRTLALSNPTAGQTFTIRLIQDGTGSRTVTWFTTIKWAEGVTPTLTTTASKTDVFGFICTSAGNYDGFIIGQNL